jgi:hypothetical protein
MFANSKARKHLAGMTSELADALGQSGVPIVYGVVKPPMLLFMPAGYVVCEATSQANLGLRLSFCASFGPRHTVPLQNLQAIAGVLSAGVLKDSMEGFLATSLAAHAADANANKEESVVQGQVPQGEDGGQPEQEASKQKVPEKGTAVVEAADNKQEFVPAPEEEAPQDEKTPQDKDAPQEDEARPEEAPPKKEAPREQQEEGAPEEPLPAQASSPSEGARPMRSAAKSAPLRPAAKRGGRAQTK